MLMAYLHNPSIKMLADLNAGQERDLGVLPSFLGPRVGMDRVPNTGIYISRYID